MSDHEILEVLRKDLDDVPGAIGMNNHQGSAVTADERIMRLVLSELADRGVFFLDSLTTSASAVRSVSEDLGLPYLSRDVFLDNDKRGEAIREAFANGLTKIGSKGQGVMIGHVSSDELPDVLSRRYAELIEAGYAFVSLAELFRDAEER